MNRRLLVVVPTLIHVVLLVPRQATASVDTAWVRRYDGPVHADDFATAIAVDSVGNVYVCGVSYGTGTGADFVTMKYWPNGDTAWVRRWARSGDDRPQGMAVDALGNVYVGGAQSNKWVVLKYDSAGRLIWLDSAGYGRYGSCRGLVLDGNGDVLACGGVVWTSGDFATVKYRSDGDTAWARYCDWLGLDDAAEAVAIGTQCEVLITGTCADSNPGGSYLTVRYDETGGESWTAYYDGPEHGADWASDIAVDGSGNVLVTGMGDNGYGTSPDYLTIRYNSAGETTWVRRHNGTSNGWDEALAVAVDMSGNAYVTGYARNSGTGNDCVTIKYSPTGEAVWVAEYNSPANSSDGGLALVLDSSGYAYVAGVSYRGAPIQADGLLIKYGSDGETLWVRRYSSPATDDEQFTACAVDRAGSIYVAGSTSSQSQGLDVLVVKYREIGDVAESPEQDPVSPGIVVEPSPFRSQTHLRFSSGDAVRPTLLVFDAAGRRVRRLDGDTGSNQVIWDGKDDNGWAVPAGVYTIVVEGGQDLDQVKVVKLE